MISWKERGQDFAIGMGTERREMGILGKERVGNREKKYKSSSVCIALPQVMPLQTSNLQFYFRLYG